MANGTLSVREIQNVDPNNFRWRHPPPELGDVPKGTCPEVRQIVQEALEKRHTMVTEDMGESTARWSFTLPPTSKEKGHKNILKSKPKRLASTRANVFVEAPTESIGYSWYEAADILGLWPKISIQHQAEAPPSVDASSSEVSLAASSSTQSSKPVSPLATSNTDTASSFDSSFTEALSELTFEPESNGKETRPSPNPKNWLMGRLFQTKPLGESPLVECLTCATEFPAKQVVTLNCKDGHKYCTGCFDYLIRSGCENEASFPPRCCQTPVSSRLIYKNASKETQKLHTDMNQRLKIPAGERWYCPHKQCLKPFDIRKAVVMDSGVRCTHCREVICVSCKQVAHLSSAQCNDAAWKAALIISEKKGWQKCYKCGEMVELMAGCRHVTCKCKAEFCYVCRRRWHTCEAGHKCAEKLDRIREARGPNEGAGEDDVQVQNAIAAAQAAQRAQPGQAARPARIEAVVTQPAGTATRRDEPQNPTEREQINNAIRETLRDLERLQERRALEESRELAEALAQVARLEAAEQERKKRLGDIESRFAIYRKQLEEVHFFQKQLLMGRHTREASIEGDSISSAWRNADWQWLRCMIFQREAILAEDEKLIRESDFNIQDYRIDASLPSSAEASSSATKRKLNTTGVSSTQAGSAIVQRLGRAGISVA